MQKSILLMSFFGLSFLFSGCTQTLHTLSVGAKEQIAEILDIKEVKQTCKRAPVQVYVEPKVRYCSKEMSKDECLIFMSENSMKVRRVLRKQLKVCKSYNRRYR